MTPLFGVTGWKNSGKTTLTERLIAELTGRGYHVSSLKHAHHGFDIDKPGADSYRHRDAGAREVAIVSGNRWALMHELRGEDEPAMREVVARMSPCDVVIVEGYKRESHPKIECRRRDAARAAPLAVNDPKVVAVASDHATDSHGLPAFDLEDVSGIAGFVETYLGLTRPPRPAAGGPRGRRRRMIARPRLIDDCFLTDKERMRHDEALAVIRERLTAVVGVEEVPLDRALGRIVAEPVKASRSVPATDNAAVDGYAFAHADYVATAGRMPVSVRIAAGHPASFALPAESAARIFTGAVMPEGADTVAMQEDCILEESQNATFVTVPEGLGEGANRRRAGEDLASGAVVAAAGTVLSAADIGAIASTGAGTVRCFERLRVAILSSGDEILAPGEPFRAGGVYDTNRLLLASLLATLPVEIADLGIVADHADEVRGVLAAAARAHHAVISSGGASRGEEDHVIEALGELGKRHLWQIAVKPGRPMSFGQIGGSVFLGLPGNPVAVFVCFALYVRPALLALAGARWREPHRLLLEADFEIAKKKTDRREFLRGILVDDPDGIRRVTRFPRDGSGLITGLREADGLIELSEETASVARGDAVRFIPFTEFGLPPR